MATKFSGEFYCNLDASNRLIIPRKYLVALPDCLVLIIDASGAICIFSRDGVQRFVDKCCGEPSNEKKGSLGVTACSRAVEARVDSRGRIALPASFIERAGITGKEVVVTGQGDHLIVTEVNNVRRTV